MNAKVIPFYGAERHDLFALERRAMDRQGALLRCLDSLLPAGPLLDVGAGDGYTAARLTRPGRPVVALEPAPGMVDRGRALPWVRGVAQELPFARGAFRGLYATWAFYFSHFDRVDVDAGLREAHRVVARGGPLIVADNAGGDEFSSLAGPAAHASDPGWWRQRGFHCRVLESAFTFDTLAEARRLLGFYFGEPGRRWPRRTIGFRIAVYTRRSQGC